VTEGVVLHFGPDLDKPGGVASVIQAYVDADLRPWTIDFVSIYTPTSRFRQIARLVVALAVLSTRSRRRIDGVHVHTSYGFDLVRAVLLLETARRRKFPTIVTVHGSRFMTDVRRAPRLVRAIFERADAVTVLSEEVHAAALTLGARHTSLLPNPVEPRPSARSVDARKQVLFAGEIGHRKGVDVLLQAWRKVHAEHSGVSLLLLGPIADPTLIASLPDGVHYGGPLPRAGVLAALDSSCLAVLPSRAEAMPMFVLEAMAAGVPVVATDVGGIKSTLGDAGVIVTVGDSDALASAIMELLADPDRLVEMSRCGQRLVSEHYSTEVFTRNVVALYDNTFRP
jgi:glycosyltransferase involved in cell wall biosynthesis